MQTGRWSPLSAVLSAHLSCFIQHPNLQGAHGTQLNNRGLEGRDFACERMGILNILQNPQIYLKDTIGDYGPVASKLRQKPVKSELLLLILFHMSTGRA